MNVIGTLGKVAMGVMVARGIGKMLSKRGGGTTGAQDGGLGGGLGDLLGGKASGGAGLNDVLGSVLGGGSSGGSGGGGLLGGVLGSVLGGASQSQSGGSGGGLGDLLGGAQRGGLGGALGSALGAEGRTGGGLGGLLDSLGGGSSGGSSGGSGSLGDLLNSALNGQNLEPAPSEEEKAEILLRAMLMACKADGEIDDREQQRIGEHLGDVSPEEAEFVRSVLRAPVDIDGLARETPDDMAQQVYMMSVLAIDLDAQAEAQYLHELAQALKISQSSCNAIHQQLGVPTIYR
ncbi:MAG: DUF533 domain-containing protein [Pseudomonadota bacterium]